jgi:hypothetical protein
MFLITEACETEVQLYLWPLDRFAARQVELAICAIGTKEPSKSCLKKISIGVHFQNQSLCSPQLHSASCKNHGLVFYAEEPFP